MTRMAAVTYAYPSIHSSTEGLLTRSGQAFTPICVDKLQWLTGKRACVAQGQRTDCYCISVYSYHNATVRCISREARLSLWKAYQDPKLRRAMHRDPRGTMLHSVQANSGDRRLTGLWTY